MNIFLTSDQHYDHRNIILLARRPFDSLEHMQNELIVRHNAVVGPKDIVYHLGDFSLNEKAVPKFLPHLHGRHILISGNHDCTHRCHHKSVAAIIRYIDKGFAEVHQEIMLDGFLLNHLPYMPALDSGYDVRYPEWRPENKGAILLHGHVHTAWKVRNRMINVGVDQFGFAPVSLDVIKVLAKDL